MQNCTFLIHNLIYLLRKISFFFLYFSGGPINKTCFKEDNMVAQTSLIKATHFCRIFLDMEFSIIQSCPSRTRSSLSNTKDKLITHQVNTYITPQGTLLTPTVPPTLDNSLSSVSSMYTMFSTFFQEQQVVEFIVSTFCIPLL